MVPAPMIPMVLITMLLVKGDESSDKADVCAGKGKDM